MKRRPEVSVTFERASMRVVEYDDDGQGNATYRSLEVDVRPSSATAPVPTRAHSPRRRRRQLSRGQR